MQNNMNGAALAAVVVLVAGCAASAPALHTRAADGAALSITGSYSELNGRLLVAVNGAPAIDGRLSLWDGSGTLAGQYDGRPVVASCAQVRRGLAQRLECAVTIEAAPAGSLVF